VSGIVHWLQAVHGPVAYAVIAALVFGEAAVFIGFVLPGETAVVIGGVLAGLGGAYFTLESVPHFEPLMTNGRGFIALAAMIFGKWTPVGAWGAALLFGVAEAIPTALQLQGITVPFQLVGLLPYLLTIVVVAGAVGRSTPPAAVGIPYERQ
jgi:simple sugar transport system permease protein